MQHQYQDVTNATATTARFIMREPQFRHHSADHCDPFDDTTQAKLKQQQQRQRKSERKTERKAAKVVLVPRDT